MRRIVALSGMLLSFASSGGGAPLGDLSVSLPVRFEQNSGQFPEEFLYGARISGGTILITRQELLFVSKGDGEDVVGVRFGDGNPDVLITGAEEVRTQTHYFHGNDPSQWQRGVRSFERVRLCDLYPGIDVELYGMRGTIEADFVVSPGADASRIRLTSTSGSEWLLGEDDAILSSGTSRIRFHPPVTYQIDGTDERQPVSSAYEIATGSDLRFTLGDRDETLPLVIDPVMTFSTYLGGSDVDNLGAMATDREGNVYLAGYTYSLSFLGVDRPPLRQPDPFVMKLSPAMEILFVTFFGSKGEYSEGLSDLVVDDTGNVYVIGTTGAPDFPLVNPLQSSLAGEFDAFITVFDHVGDIKYSTYLGGRREDGSPQGIAVGPDGSIFAGMFTTSTDLPLVNATQSVIRGGSEIYLFRLAPGGGSIMISTYLGGSGEDYIGSVLFDGAGNLILVGNTRSADFPTKSAFQQEIGGGYDLFARKLSADGREVVYSTFMGGSGHDNAYTNLRIAAVDEHDELWLAGYTQSSDFPLVGATSSVAQPLFLARLTKDGQPALSNYISGPTVGAIKTLVLDRDGSILIGGFAETDDLPLVSPMQGWSGGWDAFLMRLSRTAAILQSTYLGGSNTDIIQSMSLDPEGRLYVAGVTSSVDLPMVNPIQDHLIGDANQGEGFLMRLEERTLAIDQSRVLPVVGSLAGGLGSFFRTAVQLHNPTDQEIGARFVFHPSGTSGEESDPSFDVWLGPGQTRSFSDLLPAMGQSGIGSVDLLTGSQVPLTVTRIFNDAGEAGTTGMTTVAMREADALEAGDTGYVIAPPDPATARFNLGVRTLGEGATANITVRRADGSIAGAVQKSLSPNYFIQMSADNFLGIPLMANDSIAIEVASGNLILYGATTDNTTQDPSLQIARRSPAGSSRVIPVVGSLEGAFGSFFRTTVQLHNPSNEMIEGRVVFHPAGASGKADDPSLSYAISAGGTIVYLDLLPAIGLGGIGSADLDATAGDAPVSVVRIFNDAGEAGTTGMTEDAIGTAEALSVGESGILIAPPDPLKSRFNVGVRTLAFETTVTITVKSASGNLVSTTTKTYPPNYFEQKAASEVAGLPLGGDDTITFLVTSGSAIVYGSTTDNTTQDPSLQIARDSW